jgi:hypothetical protein
MAHPYSWIVETTDGERHDLSTADPLFVGEVIYGEVIERIEPAEGRAGRVVCRKPRALVQLLLEQPRPSPHPDELVTAEADPGREYRVGDVLRQRGYEWRVRSVGPAEEPHVARLGCERVD